MLLSKSEGASSRLRVRLGCNDRSSTNISCKPERMAIRRACATLKIPKIEDGMHSTAQHAAAAGAQAGGAVAAAGQGGGVVPQPRGGLPAAGPGDARRGAHQRHPLPHRLLLLGGAPLLIRMAPPLPLITAAASDPLRARPGIHQHFRRLLHPVIALAPGCIRVCRPSTHSTPGWPQTDSRSPQRQSIYTAPPGIDSAAPLSLSTVICLLAVAWFVLHLM